MSDKALTTTEEPTSSAGSAEADAAAQDAADKQAAEDAEARLYTGDALTYTEYDAIGKGKDYKPSPEVKASLAAKDKAVSESAATVNNLTPAEHDAAKASAKSGSKS